MPLLDALTGGPGQQAAIQQQGAIASLYPALNQSNATAHDQAQQYLTTGYNNAAGNLGTGFTGARSDIGSGFDAAQNALGTGYGASTGAINAGAGGALGYLGQGTQGALGQLGQARDALTANGGAYSPLTALAGQYGQGANLYADSLGINGAQGNQNAVNAFQTGPGYEFARNQGIDAITRAANASGGLGGNSLKDTISYGQGLANQEYGNWQNKLAPYNQLQLGATQGAAAGNQAINSGVANTYGAGANLLDSSGRAQAGVATGQGNSLSDLARQYYGGMGQLSTSRGASLGSLDTGQGSALAGLDTGQGSALAGNSLDNAKGFQNITTGLLNPYLDTYKQQANAANAASKNQLDLGMNLAKLAVSAGTGMPMGGGGGGGSFAGDLTGFSGNNGSSLSNLLGGNFFPAF
jgi:hypothetical protein